MSELVRVYTFWEFDFQPLCLKVGNWVSGLGVGVVMHRWRLLLCFLAIYRDSILLGTLTVCT